MPTGDPIVVDACSLLNLLASGVVREVAEAFSERLLVVPQVLREAVYVEDDTSGADRTVRVDTKPLIEDGVLQVATLSHAEVELFVEFALDVDDGEAATVAVAANRGWMVATDDRRALRLMATQGVRVLRTSDLMRHWAEADNPGSSEEAVRDALNAIQRRGRFRPPADDPNLTWWHESVT